MVTNQLPRVESESGYLTCSAVGYLPDVRSAVELVLNDNTEQFLLDMIQAHVDYCLTEQKIFEDIIFPRECPSRPTSGNKHSQ